MKKKETFLVFLQFVNKYIDNFNYSSNNLRLCAKRKIMLKHAGNMGYI